jgi:hypothetical protein
MEAMVFLGIHGSSHFIGQQCSMAVLKGPHTLKIKKGDTIATMEYVM